MNTFSVSISPMQFDRKPENSEVPQIQSKFVYSGMTYNQLIEHSSQPYSYTIAPAVFKSNNRTKENWTSQQVYMLDFDGTISIEAVIARFKEYDIVPNYYYTTFSHTNSEPRFRVVLLTDFLNSNVEDGNRIRVGLKKVFPEADPSCFGAERMFYGGKESFPLNNEPISFSKLEQMISIYVLEADNGKSRGLMSEDGYRYSNYNSDTRFEPGKSETYLQYLEGLSENKFDFDQLYDRAEIFRDFIDGKWLYHNQLFGIATNLRWLKGGAKLFNDTMKKHNESGITNYSSEKFRIMTYLAHRTYFPTSLKNFSLHPGDWQYGNLITAVRFPVGRIERIQEQELITLAKANEIFERESGRAFNAKDKKIYIFKVPTGFGKTTFLTKLHGQFIAFPTHRLKDEKNKIMNEENRVEHIAIPELPKFGNHEINSKIKCYYDMGLNDAVRKVLMAVATGNDYLKTTTADQNQAQDYLNRLNAKPGNEITVLTTHQRALLSEIPKDTIIFDEDPIKDILSVDVVSFSDLLLFNSNLPKENKFDEALEKIQSAVPGIVMYTDISEVPREVLSDTLVKKHVKTNVVKFVNSLAFIKMPKDGNNIYFITHRPLPVNKKVIIMSATAQTHLYEKLYPERIEVIDISNIEQVGKVYQHTDVSCSRESLDEYSITDIRDEIGHIPVITFKSKKNKFNHIPMEMHFGNLQGYNELTGSDIAVIGTYHYNDLVYRLMGFAVGVNPNSELELKSRMVNYGDYRFRFKTFEDPEMQKIQLGLIEAELIQAVGRSRTLREDCVVELYSNLPLSFSTIKNAA